MPLGERAGELDGVVVGVAVREGRRVGDALDHVRQRRVRRLVAGQLDRAGHGAPGDVGRQLAQHRPQTHCHRFVLSCGRLVDLDPRLASLDQGRLQRCDDLVDRGGRHLDGRELVRDLDGADVAAGQAGLVGDRADEVLRADLRGVPETDEHARASGRRSVAAARRDDRRARRWRCARPGCPRRRRSGSPRAPASPRRARSASGRSRRRGCRRRRGTGRCRRPAAPRSARRG